MKLQRNDYIENDDLTCAMQYIRKVTAMTAFAEK
jgi:hypothetical protein